MKRRLGLVAGVFVLLLVALGTRAALERGSRADRCAERLAQAVSQKDRPFLDQAVSSPLLKEEMLSAARFELVFVRPGAEASISRVGYALAGSATATRAQVLVLQLASEDESCRFLRDDEPGAFSRP